MDNKTYDEYMLNLFKDCSFKALEQSQNSRSNRENINIVSSLFEKTSTLFNEVMATDFLIKLNEKNPTLSSKIKNYPESFWKTEASQEHIRSGINYELKKSFTKISEIIDKYQDNIIENNHNNELATDNRKESFSKFLTQDANKAIFEEAKNSVKNMYLSTKEISEQYFHGKNIIYEMSNYLFTVKTIMKESNSDLDPSIININSFDLIKDKSMFSNFCNEINASLNDSEKHYNENEKKKIKP